MGLGKMLAETYAEIGLHGIGLHAYVDVTILVGSEHIVAELQSNGRIVRMEGIVVVQQLLIGIIEEVQGIFVGVLKADEVLTADEQTCREVERLVPEGMYLAQDIKVPEIWLDGQFNLIHHL